MKQLRGCIFAVLLLVAASPVLAQQQEQEAAVIWRLLDYVAVDYAGAVQDGRIVKPAEYAEMREFSTTIGEKIAALPATPRQPQMLAESRRLGTLIDQRTSSADVAAQARSLAGQLIKAYPVPLAPASAPDLARGAELYQQMCSACHGPAGAGDGPVAAALNPPPVDFTDESRARERSLFALYQVIGQGLEGTAMASFAQLSDQDRWALAFHIGQFAYPQAASGTPLVAGPNPLGNLQQLVQTTPAALAQQVGDQRAREIMAYLRRNPEAAVPATGSLLAIARARLSQAVTAHARGDQRQAKAAALSSYLQGFEPIEPQLTTRAPKLMQQVEQGMLGLRASIDRGADSKEVEGQAKAIMALFDEVESVLSRKADAGGWSAFIGALIILVREGLEALLIVIAILAFLRKAERPEAMRYIHAGWLGAMVAGVGTWALATYAVGISGAQREVVEGLSALFAAVVLVSVGIWLHQKSYAGRWQQYLKEKLSHALSRQSAWVLFLLSFVAVYREVFETILFYAAMWNQGGDNGMIVAGFLAGAVILAGVAVAILRFSRRLPIGQFFAWSSLLMAILAVVLTGKGIAELQEAGWLDVAPISFPSIDWLGIYPSLQVVIAQATTLLVLIGAWLYNRRAAVIAARRSPPP